MQKWKLPKMLTVTQNISSDNKESFILDTDVIQTYIFKQLLHYCPDKLAHCIIPEVHTSVSLSVCVSVCLPKILPTAKEVAGR